MSAIARTESRSPSPGALQRCAVISPSSIGVPALQTPSAPLEPARVVSLTLASVEQRLAPYFALLNQYPEALGPIGDHTQGEIEIIRDVKIIAQIEEDTGQTVGILAQNKWQLWICDAVQFPDGRYGTYGRFVWQSTLKNKGVGGAAALPYTSDGKVLLLSIFRHATRSWELEVPRGCSNPEELASQTLTRELKEETGALVDSSILLGETSADTGCLVARNSLFKVTIQGYDDTQRDSAEQGCDLHVFTLEKLREIIKVGSITLTLHGRERRVYCRDPFLLSALCLENIHGLSPQRQLTASAARAASAATTVIFV